MDREQEIKRIIKSFEVYNVPDVYIVLIRKVINSDDWDWFLDMDGCSFVPNYWPTKYNPACLVHDYYWRTGRGGYWSDRIFLEMMEIYSIPKWQRLFRFAMVRIGWVLYFKRKHKQNKNVKDFDVITNLIINKWKN